MRVMLLNAPPVKTSGVIGFVYPPLGILYLAAYARNKIPGLEIKAVDGYQEDYGSITAMVRDFRPDVLGVSFTTQASTGAYSIINEVKGLHPETFVVAGGPHPTLMPGEVLERSKADLAAIGEGEETFFEVLTAVRDGLPTNTIAGTAVMKDGAVRFNPQRPLIQDLDTIPFPARDLLDLKRYPGYYYKKKSRDTSLISARGCPYNCVFCSNPVWKYQKPWYRLRSARNVVDEMEQLVGDYGITEFYDQTDEFNGNKKWAKGVCDELLARGLNISWKAQMRADNMDDELASKMVASGCWLGFFGVESGNNRTLEGIGKRLDVETVEKSLMILKRAGMKTFALLMAFNVWEEDGELRYEDKADTLRTLEFARRMVAEKKIDLMSWSLTTPFPGSKLYDIALRHKLIPEENIGRWELWDPSSNFVMRLPGVTEDDWMDIQTKGKRLQARLLLTSGTFNIMALPLYLRKLYSLAARALGKALGVGDGA